MNKNTKNVLIFLSAFYLLFITGCSLKAAPSTSTKADKEDKSITTQKSTGSSENTIVSESENEASKAPAAPQNAEAIKPALSNEITKANSIDKSNNAQADSTKNLKYNTESIPVLTYHSVGNTNGNELIISPELLDKEMQWLKDNGYTTLTLDEAYNFFTKNKPVPKKSVVLTFDDGYVDNYANMYPIIKKYGFKATIFVISTTVDKDPNYLTSEQLKELHANGIDIQSHTVYHDKLGTLSYEKQLETMKNSKLFIENLLNKKVSYLAYPEGSYNDVTPQAAKEAGYTMAFTMDGRWSNKNNGIYKLYRVYISAFFDINTFKERVTNPQYKLK